MVTHSKAFINSGMEMGNKEVEKCIWISLYFLKAQINDKRYFLRPYDIISQPQDCLYKEALHLLRRAYGLVKHDMFMFNLDSGQPGLNYRSVSERTE